uniref:Uncharacterized protein n=1 Tax=Rhizophora mucronata TaxID=61149 RepID=A0A2P2MDT8_RHIMU
MDASDNTPHPFNSSDTMHGASILSMLNLGHIPKLSEQRATGQNDAFSRWSQPSKQICSRQGHANSRAVTARQPTRERLTKEELQNLTAVKLSQLSRTKDFSIGHPPPILKISQIEFVKDSQSVRSTSCKHWHCKASVVKFSCLCNANF